ncbi:ADOP family duplicated permease [Dokdonella sp.]|uniref:ADOP family duplicated permease n=1 Tax=Dokdonella sp. TaxID=2291710 RepID=UPI003C55DE96
MHAISHELKQATRSIVGQPGFSILVVGVLAAGLTAVVYMLIAIGSMIMRPLPFPDAERLHYVGYENGPGRQGQLDDMRIADLIELRDRLAGLATIGGFSSATINLSDMDRPERFEGAMVSGNLFSLLGTAPALGRDFSRADEQEGAPKVVMLSDKIWRSRYNADPAVVGRQIRVNAETATVVGVMPEDFSFPQRQEVWSVAHLVAGQANEFNHVVVLRQADTADVTTINTAIAGWAADAAAAEPDYFRGLNVAMEPLSWMAVNQRTRTILGIMLIAVVLVLLVACANAANLLLTRTLGRRQELAVRIALGASRGRLVLHLLSQSLLLTLIAVAIAIPLASAAANWTERTFRASDEGPPHWLHFTLDPGVIWMTIGVALLTALAAGLLPALRAGSDAMAGDLRDGTRSVSAGGFARVSRALVVGEVALSCALLIAVGTLVNGISALDRNSIGVDPTGILTARIGLFPSTYPTGPDQVRFFEQVSERVRSDPAVLNVTVATHLPAINTWDREFTMTGEVHGDGSVPRLLFEAVDDRFLDTYSLRLREGRWFDQRDSADTPLVALVDERFAGRHARHGSIVGQRVRLDPRDEDGPEVTVIGVVADMRLTPPGGQPRPALLVPLRQSPSRFVSLAVKVQGDPAAFMPRLNELIREVDADTPAYWVRTYAQALREETFAERLLAKIFAALGVIALVLAGAGLYGVMAFNVGQRTREIGVRRALGARNSTVLQDLVRRVGWQLAIGLLVGLGLGIPFARMLSGALPAIQSSEALVALTTIVVLSLATACAVVIPARRALRVDPVVALRHE